MLMLFFCTARYCSILPLPTITLLLSLSLTRVYTRVKGCVSDFTPVDPPQVVFGFLFLEYNECTL